MWIPGHSHSHLHTQTVAFLWKQWLLLLYTTLYPILNIICCENKRHIKYSSLSFSFIYVQMMMILRKPDDDFYLWFVCIGVCFYTGRSWGGFLRDSRVFSFLGFILLLCFSARAFCLRFFFFFLLFADFEAWLSACSPAKVSFRAGEVQREVCVCSRASPGTVILVWSCLGTFGSLVSGGSQTGGGAGVTLCFSFVLAFLTFPESASPLRRPLAAARSSISCILSTS